MSLLPEVNKLKSSKHLLFNITAQTFSDKVSMKSRLYWPFTYQSINVKRYFENEDY